MASETGRSGACSPGRSPCSSALRQGSINAMQWRKAFLGSWSSLWFASGTALPSHQVRGAFQDRLALLLRLKEKVEDKGRAWTVGWVKDAEIESHFRQERSDCQPLLGKGLSREGVSNSHT